MKKIEIYYTTLLLLISFTLWGCGNHPHDVEKVSSLPQIFPDYIDVTVPAEIAPLNFAVLNEKEEAERVDVTVKGANGEELHSNGKYADFDIKKWHKLTEENRGKKLTVTVCAKINGKWLQYKDFHINVSKYPLDQWGLTYRRIAPGYEVYSKMGIYQRNLGNFDEFPIIENTMTDGQCYNCHTSNRTDPKEFLFHVRGDHGATMVYKEGRYCAFSTNQTRQGFHISGPKRLEVFDLSSDVFVYDTDKNEIILDTLLRTKDWSENSPSFSPDGKWLYFTTSLQQQYPLKHKDERYNLCRIAFDEATGSFGDRVDTLFNATAIGKSVSWPRPSYDGRYILFTLSDYGYFSIWHKESDQWLLDLNTGNVRPADEINSDDADSFHNWSENSRWVVFTSRRNDGLYSMLYITGIDDKGRFSKPFLLPQKNPLEYYRQSLFSFNTPDFTKYKVEFDSRQAVDAILSDERTPVGIK